MLGTSLTSQLNDKKQAFDEKFEKIFNLAEKVLILLSFTYSFLFHFLIFNNLFCLFGLSMCSESQVTFYSVNSFRNLSY